MGAAAVLALGAEVFEGVEDGHRGEEAVEVVERALADAVVVSGVARGPPAKAPR